MAETTESRYSGGSNDPKYANRKLEWYRKNRFALKLKRDLGIDWQEAKRIADEQN